MSRKVHRSLVLGALPPCFPSTLLLKIPLISWTRFFNFFSEGYSSKLLNPLLSGTGGTALLLRQDSGVECRFAKICITPKPSGAPMGKFPLPIL